MSSRQRTPHIAELAEPGHVQTIIVQPSMEILHMLVLDGTIWLEVDERHLAFLGPAFHTQRAELRTIIGGGAPRPTTFFHKWIEHPRHTFAAQARIRFQGETLLCVRIDHAQAAYSSSIRELIRDEVSAQLGVAPQTPADHAITACASVAERLV